MATLHYCPLTFVAGWLGLGGGGFLVLHTAEFWVFRVHTAMLDFPAV